MANHDVETKLKIASNEAVKGLQNVAKTARSAKNEVDNLGNSAENMGNKASKSLNIGKMLNRSAILGFVGTIKNTLSSLEKLTTPQAEYIENLNFLDAAYSGAAQSGLKLLDVLEKQVGYDPAGLTRSLAVFRQFGNALDMDADVADRLAENLLKLSIDTKSITGDSLAKVTTKFKSALAGSTRAVREYGVDITVAGLQQEAYKLGLDRTVSSMSRAEKTILTYITMADQLSLANGDLSKTVNSTANQMEIFRSQIGETGRLIGAFFVPILRSILPVLNGIAMAINTVLSGLLSLFGIDASSMFAEFGSSTSDIEDLAGGFSDLADSAGSAGSAAKEAQKSLRGFDKLNVIRTPSTGGGSGGSGGGGGIGGLGAIDPKLLSFLDDYNLRLDQMRNKATEIRDRFLQWLSLLEPLKKPLQELADIGFDSLKYLWNNVLQPLGKWVGYRLFPAFINTVRAGLEAINSILKASQPILKFVMEGVIIPLGRVLGNTILNILRDTAKFLDGIAKSKFWSTIIGGAASITALYIAGNKLWGILGNTKLGAVIKSTTTLTKGMFDVFTKTYKTTGNLSKSLNAMGGTFAAVHTTLRQVKSTSGNVVLEIDKMKTSMNYAKTAGEGLLGSLIGFQTLKSTFQDIGTNGVNAGTAITGLIGTFATLNGTINGVNGVLGIFDTILGTSIAGGPIGLAIGAIAGLGVAIAGVVSGLNNSIDPINKYNEEIQNMKQVSNEQMLIYERQSEKLNSLANELNNYVDTNGRVQDSDKDRVNYILTELNNAMGTQYQLTGNQITKNGELISTTKGIIDETKKYTIQLRGLHAQQAFEGAYNEALKQEYERKKALTDIQNNYNLLYQKYNTQLEQGIIDQQRYDEIMKELNNTYDEQTRKIEKQYSEAHQTVKDYEALNTAVTKGNIDEIEKYYNNLMNNQVKISNETTSSISRAFSNVERSVEKSITQPLSQDRTSLGKQSATSWQTGFQNKLNTTPLKTDVQVGANTTSFAQSIANLTRNTAAKVASIQFKADGGFVDTGELFVANEAGPEIVGKIGNRTAVANNDQIVSSISIGVAKALSGINFNPNVTITANSDTQGLLNFIDFQQSSRKRQYGL